MISNQILQSTIDGLKGITRIDICVMDTEGKVLATTIDNAEKYENSVEPYITHSCCVDIAAMLFIIILIQHFF